MLNFLKELPQIYILWVCFVIVFVGFLYTRDNNIFILANLTLGGVIGVVQRSDKKATPSQDIETQNVVNQNIPGQAGGGGLNDTQ